MLFDGGSLVLYMCAVVVYIANTVKGLRIVTQGTYGGPVDEGVEADGTAVVQGREENLKVFSASNTILALVLVGVLVLQSGQWYAERAEEREKIKIAEDERKEREGDGEKEGGVGRKSSQREGKKSK